MTDKKKLGDRGEDYTARYLEKQGFHIVERNWHSRYGEIDIIAENEKYLLFVEVKTRKAGSMEYPTDRQPRFDVAALTVEGDKLLDFTYYKSAF